MNEKSKDRSDQTPSTLEYQAKMMGMWFTRQMGHIYIHVRPQLPGSEPYTQYDMSKPAAKHKFNKATADRFVKLIAEHCNHWDGGPFEWDMALLRECVEVLAVRRRKDKYPTLRGFEYHAPVT